MLGSWCSVEGTRCGDGRLRFVLGLVGKRAARSHAPSPPQQSAQWPLRPGVLGSPCQLVLRGSCVTDQGLGANSDPC